MNRRHGPQMSGTTKMLIFLTASVCSIYFIYFTLSPASEPLPRPRLYAWQSPVIGKWSIQLKVGKIPCQLPKLQPFDPSVVRYFKKPGPVNCGKGRPLIFQSDLNRTLIQVADPGKFNYSKCCFHSFEKVESSKVSVKFSKSCVPITQENTVLDDSIEFIQVNCFNGKKTVAGDFFGFIPPKSPLKFAANQQVTPALNDEDEHRNGFKEDRVKKHREVNVVILGIDSVSHMNFQRVMPLSYAYLTQNLSAMGISGLTKIGDNTFPNIVPVLTGLSVTELEKACWNKTMQFDGCPFIWKNFSSQGYLTAYGEDAVGMGIFRSGGKRGFHSAPTNYYYNTLMLEMEKKMGHHHRSNTNWCYASRLSFDILIDFLKRMAVSIKKEQVQRYFQFIWATALTHDELNAAGVGDQSLLDALIWFKDGAYLEDTIFILMSDHGMRFGGLLDTPQGRIEGRMPFLYFVFPDWFIQQYRSAVYNMRSNEQKLTTPFDLHETLFDLLFLQNITNEKVEERRVDLEERGVRPRGISLFLPVPADRSCRDAAIPDAWCVCGPSETLDVENNKLVKEAAEQTVKFINEILVPYPKCRKLTLKAVREAQVFQIQGEDKDNVIISKAVSTMTVSDNILWSNQSVSFYLYFQTSPNNANYETVTTREANGTWTTSKEVSRTNLYESQSRCISNSDMKKFCSCR